MDLEWQLCLYPRYCGLLNLEKDVMIIMSMVSHDDHHHTIIFSGKDCEDEEHVSILLELVSRWTDLCE